MASPTTPESSAARSVALLAVGDPESPRTWSGTTAGILAGLRGLGVQAHAVDLMLPAGMEQPLLLAGAAGTRNRYDAHSAAVTMRVRGALARMRLRGLLLDGVIQVGTTCALPPELPYVTLEDMTLQQARLVHPVFSRMSPAGVQGWERRRARVYGNARACATASHWAADSLRRDYGVSSERIAVVGLGANHAAGAQSPARDWSRPRFLFVGIDWERKGGPLVLEAFARLRRLLPDARLDLVGGHPRVEQAGVRSHGVRSQSDPEDRELLAELFARATCLVMPSSVEPFGIVHIEAAVSGIPSIGSSVGGPRDVIAPPAGGLVVEPHDREGLFEAMHRLSDPATAAGMGEAAQARARLYTWPKVAERLLGALGLTAPDGRELAAPI